MPKLEIEKTTIKDIPKIKGMINRESIKNSALRTRSLEELYARIRQIYVVKDKGKVVASGALKILSDNLAEINCFVVSSEYRDRGLEKKILKKLIGEAKFYNIHRVIALTYMPEVLKEVGFMKGTKEELEQKHNRDCIHCDRYPDECKAEFFIKYL